MHYLTKPKRLKDAKDCYFFTFFASPPVAYPVRLDFMLEECGGAAFPREAPS